MNTIVRQRRKDGNMGLNVLSTKPWVLCGMLGGPTAPQPLHRGFRGFLQAQMNPPLPCGLCLGLKYHQERVPSLSPEDWLDMLPSLTVPGECAWISH